ncbi:DUF6484 domain-containing protein [Escherichia coli]|uniref:DUF6484 domain-containing protein n=1 Tax=Escherichia coli TaxID=562 RepID=UPI001367FBC8|nr:DUF6484 domain-containing protein [Escherichia coli]MXE58691.1 hypothetical protein [Escherichia coli]
MIKELHDIYVPQPEEELTSTTHLLENILSHQASKSQAHVNDIPVLVVGRIVSVKDSGEILIQCPHEDKPVAALGLGTVTTEYNGRLCTVQFLSGNYSHPVVTGILPENLTERYHSETKKCTEDELNTERVVLTAKQELVLQCGESKIVLSADGLLQIRALYIDSQAQATHRLKGGSVQVN